MKETLIVYSKSMLNPNDAIEIKKTIKFWEEASNKEVVVETNEDGKIVIRFVERKGGENK